MYVERTVRNLVLLLATNWCDPKMDKVSRIGTETQGETSKYRRWGEEGLER